MEPTFAGYSHVGGWAEVVELGERITAAFIELELDSGETADAFDRWDTWRPKAHERLRSDVSEKTADEVSVKEGPGEQAGVEPTEDLSEAKRNFAETVQGMEAGQPDVAFARWSDSVGFTIRAADSVWRRTLRRVELVLYTRIMTRLSPYYFDTTLIQANIERKRGREKNCYEFEIVIPDDTVRADVREIVDQYESLNRWHLATEKNTECPLLVEGIDADIGDETDVSVHPPARAARMEEEI